MTEAWHWLRRVAPLAVVGWLATLLFPRWRPTIAALVLLALFALSAVEAVVRLARGREKGRSPFEKIARGVEHPAERPPDLEAIERSLGWKSYSPRDFDHRVRPLLVRLVDYKLMATRGISLAAQPAEARAALSDELRAVVEGRAVTGPGQRSITTPEIARVIDAIEAL